MLHLNDTSGIPFAPLAGWLGYQVTHALDGVADPAPPWFVGIAMLMLTGLLIPTANWLRARSDGRKRQTEHMAERREAREDARLAAFVQQGTAMGALAREMQLMNTNHDKLAASIEALPDKIVKKCNGK